MSEYTVKYINRRARTDAAGFIRDCEEHYHRQIHMAADEIVRNREHCPIVLINGPSSSGKTTTNDRIARIVELAGVHANMLSMDDYYRTAADYEQPMDDENGVPDLESPECMDLNLSELILQTEVPYIINRGRKGGSNVAAAICNALLYELRKER